MERLTHPYKHAHNDLYSLLLLAKTEMGKRESERERQRFLSNV